MKKIPLTLTAVAAALTAVTVAGCTPAAPSQTPSTFSTLPAPASAKPRSAVDRYLTAQADARYRGWELNAAAGLPMNADRGLAEAAAEDGAPFAVSYQVTPGWPVTCAWIRMPDASLWSLNGGTAALIRDTTAEQFLRRGNLGQPPACESGTTTTLRFDAAAETAALKAGSPYRWTDGCKQYMHAPGSSIRFWIPDLPPERGEALSAKEDMYGCRGVTVPGQTASPKEN